MGRHIERRIARLEVAGAVRFPWHKPLGEWTDAELEARIDDVLPSFFPGKRAAELTDAELRELIEALAHNEAGKD